MDGPRSRDAGAGEVAGERVQFRRVLCASGVSADLRAILRRGESTEAQQDLSSRQWYLAARVRRDRGDNALGRVVLDLL